jgi:hypothetical protein
MKNYINNILKISGYEIKKVCKDKFEAEPGSDKRLVGRIDLLLEDLKTRGLQCETVVDVGANMAEWSRMAKRIFSNRNERKVGKFLLRI